MGIKITGFVAHRKNTLQGFVDVLLERTGLEIRGCTLHEKGGKRWVAMPARPYQTPDGKTTWQALVVFSSAANKRFQDQALSAIDAYLSRSNSGAEGPVF